MHLFGFVIRIYHDARSSNVKKLVHLTLKYERNLLRTISSPASTENTVIIILGPLYSALPFSNVSRYFGNFSVFNCDVLHEAYSETKYCFAVKTSSKISYKILLLSDSTLFKLFSTYLPPLLRHLS